MFCSLAFSVDGVHPNAEVFVRGVGYVCCDCASRKIELLQNIIHQVFDYTRIDGVGIVDLRGPLPDDITELLLDELKSLEKYQEKLNEPN